jgi:predicted DNA-binding transcriptional regulator YafY
VHRPTARLLTLLELLQARKMTGAELARRLEVDRRTVRRYVETLREMGIPVEGGRGRYGAYSLKRGYKMPPLMFTDEEALGLSLGLVAARGLGISGVAPAVEGALAKVERVMPEAWRGRLRALEHTVALTAAMPATPPDGEVVSALAGATDERRRVRLRYRSARGEETIRVVDPYAVLRTEGRWHLFGHCHLRSDARLFRLDRMLEAEVLEEGYERPRTWTHRRRCCGPWRTGLGSSRCCSRRASRAPGSKCRRWWPPRRRRRAGCSCEAPRTTWIGPRDCWRGCLARLP